jgi:hypothetical protein
VPLSLSYSGFGLCDSLRALRVSGAIRAEYRAKMKAGVDADTSDLAVADLLARRQCGWPRGAAAIALRVAALLPFQGGSERSRRETAAPRGTRQIVGRRAPTVTRLIGDH